MSEALEIKLWHWRLGNVKFKLLKKLSKKEIVKGIPKISENYELCKVYKMEKKINKIFTSLKDISSTRPFHLIYIDVVGPAHIPSIVGKKYISVIVDNYSRLGWIAFLHAKSDAFDDFRVVICCNLIRCIHTFMIVWSLIFLMSFNLCILEFFMHLF